MFEIGYSLITASDSAAGTPGDATDFFKAPQVRTAMSVEVQVSAAASIKTVHKWTAPQTHRPMFDGRAVKRPQLSERKLEWPKGVPRIAILGQEPRRSKSLPSSRTLPVKPAVMPQIVADYSPGRK
jgi:hypothetical protein